MQLVAAQVANPQSIKTGVGDSEVYKNSWGGDITLVKDFRADNTNHESERYQVECTLADGQVKLDSVKKQ